MWKIVLNDDFVQILIKISTFFSLTLFDQSNYLTILSIAIDLKAFSIIVILSKNSYLFINYVSIHY